MRSMLLICIGFLAGCNRDAPATHPVHGTIVLKDGDVKLLAGSHVEVTLANDPTLRSSGLVKEDGSFSLETLHAGTTYRGARTGQYRARLILNDDEVSSRRLAAKAIAAKYLDFRTSDLSFEVPASGPITLTVQRK